MMKKLIFSERTKELRLEQKLSRKEFATIMNLDCSTIGKYEAGTRIPDLKTLWNIAEYFNVSIDYLVGKEDF